MDHPVVLITGTSSGFGRLTAETLARQGCHVFAAMRDVTGRNGEVARELKAAADRNGQALDVVEIDTGDEGSVEAGVAEVLAKAGRIDVLVNNVGQGTWGLVEGFTTKQLQHHFDVNVFSAVRMNRAVLPGMRERRSGLIVQVSSLIGRLVLPFMTQYSAAKHAVEALTEGYRYELAPFGVDVAIVEPQSFPTEGSLNKMVLPEDQARVESYGELAQRGQGMFAYNDQALRGGQGGNAQDVADAIARLVAMPAGMRPLRTVVSNGMGQLVEPINAATHEAQMQLLSFTNLLDLATLGRSMPAQEQAEAER